MSKSFGPVFVAVAPPLFFFRTCAAMWNRLTNSIARFVRQDRGATMVEYALLLALVALVCIVAVGTLGEAAEGLFTRNGSSLMNSL